MNAAGTSLGSQTASKLYTSIKDQTVSAVLPKLEGVVEVDSTAPTLAAANLLWNHNLLAVPVWDEESKSYIGYFDMRDILRAIMKVYEQRKPVAMDDADDDEEIDEDEEFISKTLQELTLEGTTDASLKSLASRRPAYYVTPQDSLEKLCQLLSQSDCRRVLICNRPNERCFDMVSRSTLIKYLSKHVPAAELTESLDQAGLDFRKEVVGVHENASAKEAFELILEKKLYGLAVVDEDGGLLGNTSARDIKLVALYNDKRTAGALDLDILSYLASVRQEDSVETGKKAKYPACNVRESGNVGHVISLLAKTGYHRVFVTNTYMEPVGVISEQDILRFVLEKGKLQLPHDLPGLAE